MAKRTRLNRPYPTQPLQDALPIAQKIQDANGGNPVETDMLAEAMGTSVKSSQFIQRLKSSAMYGLTIGAHTDEMIELTALGERLTAPGSPEEEAESRRQAALAPDVFRKFYAAYAGKAMPGDTYAANTLTRQLGVDERLAEECLGIVRRNGLFARVIEDRAGTLVVARTGGREAGSAVNDPETPPATFPESHPPAADGDADAESDSHRDRERRDAGGEDDIRIADPPRSQTLLVAAELDDPAGEAALAVARGLGVDAESAALDANGAELVPGDLLAALESARGCVFVFPPTAAAFSDGEPAAGDSARRSARAWAALGATLGRLGNRIVVVHSADMNGGGDASPSFQDLAGESVASVERAEGAALFAALAPALIQSGVIRVSVG